MDYLPRFPLHLVARLKQALVETDKLAYDNVTHDDKGQSILDARGQPVKGKFARGGPFGAMLGISLDDGSFEVVGKPRGNNVVGSGIASRHAEDQALQPDNYRSLTLRLSELKKVGANPFVWMISSAQSCPNCHTKQEIAARDLAAKGLLSPGRFVTLYGATYDETLKTAQFYDAQYADAMIYASLKPKRPENLIRQERVEFRAMPRDVRNILGSAVSPTAVIVRGGGIYTKGRDTRDDFDLYSTAEVNAVRNACVRRRQEGALASWGVDGELYTLNSQVGPLLFAEASWTKINVIKTANMRVDSPRETRDLPDIDFLRIVAGGYHAPRAAIRVVRDTDFVNTAQPQWARMLKVNGEQLYNGATVKPEVEAMRDLYTRNRFAADDIDNYTADRPARVRQPLETLEASKKGLT